MSVRFRQRPATPLTPHSADENALRFQGELLAIAGQAVMAVDLDRTILYWNHAAEEMYGWSAAEALGRNSVDVLPRRDDHGGSPAMMASMLRGEAWSGDYFVQRRDGAWLNVYVTNKPMFDTDGELVAVIAVTIDVTDLRAGDEARRRLSAIVDGSGDAIFAVTAEGIVATWNHAARRMFGYTAEEIVGRSVETLAPTDRVDEQRRVIASLLAGGPAERTETIRVRRDGTPIEVLVTCSTTTDDEGAVTGLSVIMQDISERIAANCVRQAAESRFEIGFEQSTIGAAIADLDGIPTRVNSAACNLLDRRVDDLVGAEWANFVPPEDVPLCVAAKERVAAGFDAYHDERRFVRPDGSMVWTSCHVTLVRDTTGEPQYFFVQMQDINARKAMEFELAHRAVHDALTGLPNRALLTDRLVHSLAGTRRRNTRIGVMFLDLDQFKLVNDLLGHETGDRLLCEVAARIVDAVRPDDTVARFGGDEFVIVCDDVTADEAEALAERILERVRRPSSIDRHEIHTSVSLGVAMSDPDSTPASLLRDSDAAMFLAKERGRGRVELYGESLRARAEQRWVTKAELHHALERGELTVHYQPVIDLQSGALVSAEALVRWQHPERNLVGPGEFITFAEETGLIVPIGAWVLEQACRQLGEWHRVIAARGGPERMTMAVNLSVRQMLEADVVTSIGDIIERTELSPGDLSLELTESVFMEDVDYFGRVLAELKSFGLDLAIDDFGTGYSSLSYLKRFPVDSVKIDRAFVDGLGTDPHDTALVAAIVAMAGALDLDVVAEGVETAEQLAELRALGVPRAQGFLLARPMPAAALTSMITDGVRWPLIP